MGDYRLARHRGKFAVVWYEGGRRQRRSLGTTDKAIAEAQLIEFKRIRSVQARQGPLTVGEIYAEYESEKRKQGGSGAERIGFSYKRLGPHFGSLGPSAITRDRCELYVEARHRAGVGRGTIHVELGYLRAALNYARREGWLSVVPFIPLPQKPPAKDYRLTREETGRLIDEAKMPHVRLFIILAVATAGRASAILELTWDRVDFDRSRVSLRNPLRTATPKGRAIVPMNDMARQALQEAKQAALSDYVIEFGGKRVLSVKKGVASAARRAGVKCSPHVLRHTAACLMAEGGIPMEEIAQYLGHRKTDTTRNVYARYSPDYLQKAAKTLEIQCSLPQQVPGRGTKRVTKREQKA
jgi:integrase